MSDSVTCAGHMVKYWDGFGFKLDEILRGLTSAQNTLTTTRNNQINSKFKDEVYTSSSEYALLTNEKKCLFEENILSFQS